MSNPLPPPTAPTLTVDELQTALAEATRERDQLLEDNRKLRAAVGGWLEGEVSALRNVQSALGNMLKITNEIRTYVQEGKLPE